MEELKNEVHSKICKSSSTKQSDLKNQVHSEFELHLNEEEIKCLCLQLKKNCVFKNGKGIEIDPTKSAKIFYKLGLVYSKRCDRISLIKSVGLLNSAIERKPDNVFKIEKDLYKVCQHILSNANAQDQNADLIEQANRVKSHITSMRYKTNQALTSLAYRTHRHKANLKQTDKINLIAKIQFNITEHYKKIMKNLCQYCVDVMGSPPCEFAVVGMGSLARKESRPSQILSISFFWK